MIGGRRAAVDGSFVKASANRSTIPTQKGLAGDVSRLEARISSYSKELEEADEEDTGESDTDPDRAAEVAALVARRDQSKALPERLEASGAKPTSKSDPDARHRHKSGKSAVGYNGPIAGDDQNKLSVAVDVVPDGHDRKRLAPMMAKARKAMGSEELIGLADEGYAYSEPVKACEEKGMEVSVPLPKVSSKKGSGQRYVTADFDDDGEKDPLVFQLCSQTQNDYVD